MLDKAAKGGAAGVTSTTADEKGIPQLFRTTFMRDSEPTAKAGVPNRTIEDPLEKMHSERRLRVLCGETQTTVSRDEMLAKSQMDEILGGSSFLDSFRWR